MWTHDGKHIMWGRYGKGFFVGTENLGKRCWGIYGRVVFAGFSTEISSGADTTRLFGGLDICLG